jgi:hypothetical protein
VAFSQQYDYTCYCATTSSTPDNIVQLDNNEKLLLALQVPQTLNQLQEKGLAFSQSQIRLLLDWQLIEEKDDIYQTAFPILDSTKTIELRKRMKKHAGASIAQLVDKIDALKSILTKSGREKTIYTILFSYVLDNLVWDEFENEKILKVKQNTIEHPFWAGVFWATSPKRETFCGTNSISDKGYSLKINWAPQAIPLMKPFVTDWKNQLKMFDEFITQGKVTDQQVKAIFEPFRIFDAEGSPTIPLITESPDNPLYQSCLELAKLVSEKLLDEIKQNNFKNSLGCRDEEQALVIAYHEWMWEFLDECETKGLIVKPLAFANPDRAKSSDIGDLIFLVKKPSLK